MTMTYYFLPDDFRRLGDKISELAKKIKEIGMEMGKSCEEGAETYHDNFAYEDGERQQRMISNRLRELISIRNNARVISPDLKAGRVGIGRKVTILDDDTGASKTFNVGSFMVLSNNGALSYSAPLVRLLIGAKVKETRTGVIGGMRKCFTVEMIK